MSEEAKSRQRKLVVQLTVAWLFVCFCVGIFVRFQHTEGSDGAPEVIQIAERLAVVGRYSSDLTPEVSTKLMEMAEEIEEEPQAEAVIRGEQPKDNSKLSSVYSLMAEELRESDPDRKARLVGLADKGMRRFGITAGLLFLLGLLALLSFLGPKVEGSPPMKPTTFSAVGVLGAFFLWDVLGFVGLGSLVGALAAHVDRFSLIIVSQVLLYGLMIVVLSQAGLKRDASYFRKFSPSWVGKGYFAALAIVFIVNFLTTALSGHPPKSENPVLALFAGAPNWKIATLGLLVVFVGPFFEEIIFRGWLYGGLKDEWGDMPALVLSSALFALIHGDAPGLPALFALGMVFGWVYRRSGSLWASILVHGFWNATTFALLISVMP